MFREGCGLGWHSLPVSLHVPPLQIAGSESNLAGVACERVGGLHGRRCLRRHVLGWCGRRGSVVVIWEEEKRLGRG